MDTIDVNEGDLMDTGKFRREVLDALKKACQASEDAKVAAITAAEKVDTVKRMAEDGRKRGNAIIELFIVFKNTVTKFSEEVKRIRIE